MTDGHDGRASRRGNPLSDGDTAHRYVADGRTEEQAMLLARGADIGIFFANTMKKVFELERWVTSSRNEQWLKDAGGDFIAVWSRALRERGGDEGAPAVPSGGFTRLAVDLLDHAQQVYVLSGRLAAKLTTDPRVRELVDACSNELTMLAVFATRAAKAAGVQSPTATELAALAVWVGVEKGTAGMYSGDEARQLEEKDRRVDKFRKMVDSLPLADAKVNELASIT